MPSLTTRERDTYTEVWESIPDYDVYVPGLRYLPMITATIPSGASVLDAGCGSAKLGVALHEAGYRVQLSDLTQAGLVPEAEALPFWTGCLWRDPLPSCDWVVCCDVLEHIPTQFTMLVLARLLARAGEGMIVSVSLTRDVAAPWIGRPLHLTVESFVWWRDSLAELAEIVEARDLISDAVFVLRPRR